jgi:hypothetical protein
MTDREKQKALSLYRLTQAEESLDEARYLLAGGKSLSSLRKDEDRSSSRRDAGRH